MISSNACSNVLVWNLANISVISWSFSKIFLLKIGLISTYKMPPCLPCYLIRVLSNLTQNIWKFGSSPYWPPGWQRAFIYKWGNLSHAHEGRKCLNQPVWRNGKNLNFTPLISQHSYQITSQMRWHLLVTDKLKGFDKIPTDSREIWGKPLSVFTISAIIWQTGHDKKFPNIPNIQKWHLKHHADCLINIIIDNLW